MLALTTFDAWNLKDWPEKWRILHRPCFRSVRLKGAFEEGHVPIVIDSSPKDLSIREFDPEMDCILQSICRNEPEYENGM